LGRSKGLTAGGRWRKERTRCCRHWKLSMLRARPFVRAPTGPRRMRRRRSYASPFRKCGKRNSGKLAARTSGVCPSSLVSRYGCRCLPWQLPRDTTLCHLSLRRGGSFELVRRCGVRQWLGAPAMFAPPRFVADRTVHSHGAVVRAHDGGAATAMMTFCLGDRCFNAFRGVARAVASRRWTRIHLRLCALSFDGRCCSH
jgi:hypothetical protein